MEAAAGEICIAEQRAETASSGSSHRTLGEIDRCRHVVGVERGDRAGRETDFTVGLATEAVVLDVALRKPRNRS